MEVEAEAAAFSWAATGEAGKGGPGYLAPANGSSPRWSMFLGRVGRGTGVEVAGRGCKDGAGGIKEYWGAGLSSAVAAVFSPLSRWSSSGAGVILLQAA